MIKRTAKHSYYFLSALCLAIAFILLGNSCSTDALPKPRGYFRIDQPTRSYERYSPADCPFSFKKANIATMVADAARPEEKCWMNVSYPTYNGEIHLTYRQLKGDLPKHLQDCYDLVYKHTVKADAIEPRIVFNSDKSAQGLYYDIEGNAACSVQFYVTDSVNHFLRGALYFNAAPNYDSLQPVISFCKADIDTLIQSLEWK
ncbi:MAG: gliding motility lipoprotein GldD [Bacteroidetes bacterium]|nr:gliding motility lipoprotein GldD [Bacteroidota bacterium]